MGSIKGIFQYGLVVEDEGGVAVSQIRKRAKTTIQNGKTVDLADAFEKYRDQVWDRSSTDSVRMAEKLAFSLDD